MGRRKAKRSADEQADETEATQAAEEGEQAEDTAELELPDAVTRLTELVDQCGVFADWIDKAKSQRDRFRPEIVEKVITDYLAKYHDAVRDMQPHVVEVQGLLENEQGAPVELQDQLAAKETQREELALRQLIGEIDQSEFDEQDQELATEIDEMKAELDRLSARRNALDGAIQRAIASQRVLQESGGTLPDDVHVTGYEVQVVSDASVADVDAMAGGDVVESGPAGDTPAGEEVVDEEPPVDELADGAAEDGQGADEPLADPDAGEPIADMAVDEEPIADEPIADEPIADEPIADMAVDEEPFADVAGDDAAAEDPAPVDAEPIDEPIADEPIADEPIADVAVDEPLADGLAGDEADGMAPIDIEAAVDEEAPIDVEPAPLDEAGEPLPIEVIGETIEGAEPTPVESVSGSYPPADEAGETINAPELAAVELASEDELAAVSAGAEAVGEPAVAEIGPSRTARLLMKPKHGGEEDIVISGAVFSIGRGRNNDVQIKNDGKVSRYHCRIIFKDDEYLIEDNKSSNGTIVDGRAIARKKLVGGEQIVIGETVLAFSLDA